MWAKILLATFFLGMVGSAIYFDPVRERAVLGTKSAEGPRLKLITWNIGYASLEGDSRAHSKDLPAVAETILRHDPDAVALQELADASQLEVLLGYLRGRYKGAVCSFGSNDRIEAVLVKDSGARFEDIRLGDRYATSASFRLRKDAQEVVLISAHADAFNAARRRVFTGDVVDWAHERSSQATVFVAGDFNFEVNARNQSNLFTDNLKNDSESYSYILKYFRDLGRDAGWTALNERRIDYIFGLPEVALLRRAEVIRGAAVGHMDHWPLLVEVSL